MSKALYLAGALLLISIDQLTKYWLPVIFLNTTGAFSLAWNLPLLTVLAIGMLLLVAFLGWNQYFSALLITPYSLPFIASGGVSNLLDRLFFGGVRDVFAIGGLYFNLADVYIIAAGVILLVIGIWSLACPAKLLAKWGHSR